MKEPDKNIDEIIEMLVASTRSPRGVYSASKSYPMLEKRISPKSKRLMIYKAIGSVAAIIIVCVLGWSIYQSQSVNIITVSTLGATQTVKLPDGTDITLNHYTTIHYPEKFNGKRREVTLSGEAYFEVFKNAGKPFIVQTEHIAVEVLGTHFNVEAYTKDDEIKTTLLEGSVAVTDIYSDKIIILEPYESAIYNKTSGELINIKEENAVDEIAWKQGKFIFNNISLQEITRQLSNSFGVDISIAPQLQEYKMTARFTNGESLKEILSLLGAVGAFEYTETNQHIILNPKN